MIVMQSSKLRREMKTSKEIRGSTEANACFRRLERYFFNRKVGVMTQQFFSINIKS